MVTARVPDQHRRRAIRACNTCKRRKERCDGRQPCVRCKLRKVGESCTYLQPSEHDVSSIRTQHCPAQLDIDQLAPHMQGGDNFVFGDTASLSILQRVRSLVASSFGPCELVEISLQDFLADFHSPAATFSTDFVKPVKPSQDEAEAFLNWAMLATGKMLGVHQDSNIYQNVQDWLLTEDINDDPHDAMYWIILAVGAQSIPEDRDQAAEVYFQRGSEIIENFSADDPNTTSIQTYMWMTFFLLHACRRHAAITALTYAVRGAYAVGLHIFGSTPLQGDGLFRERLWRTLRILDIFISTSLGRPPSTYEIRTAESRDADAFVNDLAQIQEILLKEIHYSKGTSAQEFTYEMMSKHKFWTQRLHASTAKLEVSPVEKLSIDNRQQSNGRVSDVKQAYYGSIMLLTWPYLVQRVSECNHTIQDNSNSCHDDDSSSSFSPFGCVAVSACVDSAVQTIEMLSGLLSIDKLPKRLPYAINSIFVAGLILGTAIFANLERDFPLDRCLHVARTLLALFQNHDPLAKRYQTTIGHLKTAGEGYIERRCQMRMATHRRMTTSLLGDVDRGSRAARVVPYTLPLSGGQAVACSPKFSEGSVSELERPQNRDVATYGVRSLRHPSTEDHLFGQPWQFVDIAELVDIDMSTPT